MSDLKSRFEKATNYVSKGYAKEQYKDSTKELTNEEKLKMYAFFKQATVGKCSEKGGERPGFFSFEAKAKYDAWAALGDMTADEAMNGYIATLSEMAPEWEKYQQ